VTPDLLRAATGCSAALADRYAVPLADACQRYSINTPARLSAFLAQIGHESGGLQYTREIAGGQAYEGRADLGNTEPGDGPRFRGRGLLQVTGRSNYAALAAALGVDFVADPSLLEQPTFAALSAAHWWHAHGCSAFADAGEFDKLSRLINRGNAFATNPANGEADRRIRWERAKAALAKIEPPAPEPVDIPTIPDDMPAGEAPDWTPPQPKGNPMDPFTLAGAVKLASAIPRLWEMFGTSDTAQRNAKAADVVVQTVTQALGVSNVQTAVEKMQADPAALAAATKAVESNWLQITESGGGGVEGARKADAAAQAGGDIRKSPSFWIGLLLLPLVYLLVLSLIGMIGSATWSDDVRAGLAGSLISAIIGGLVGYYFGQTTTRNRSASP
jgi:putative chitinase